MQGIVAVSSSLLLVAIVSQVTNALLLGIGAPRQMVQHRQSCLRLAAFDPKKELQKFVPPSIIGEEIPLSSDVTELPNTFQDAVSRAVERSMASIKSGQMRVRIDFDTSVGDMTYTSLKNSLPMMKEFAIGLTRAMQLTMSIEVPDAITSESEAAASTEVPSTVSSQASEELATMRIFFPDMGAAALARRDWKLGTEMAEVPPSVRTANMQNDPIDTSDKVAVLLCPQSSESDYVKIIMESCTMANIPCILINPNLVNMDQGYGVRARNLRKDVLNTFTTSYKLKTMKYGALVREWPRGFSVWNQDATYDDGYRLLVTYAREPSNELLLDIYDVANPDPENPNQEGPNVAVKVMGEVMGFFKGLQKL